MSVSFIYPKVVHWLTFGFSLFAYNFNYKMGAHRLNIIIEKERYYGLWKQLCQ